MPGVRFCNQEGGKKNEPAERFTLLIAHDMYVYNTIQYNVLSRYASFRHVRLSGLEARLDARTSHGY